MNRFHIYEAFKQFGTIKRIKFGERMPTYYWVNIYYVGEAEPNEALAIQKLQRPEQKLQITNVDVVMLKRPWIKKISKTLTTSINQPNSSFNLLAMLNDEQIEQIFESLPVMDLCAVAESHPRLHKIAFDTFEKRYRHGIFQYEDLKTNGFITYAEMEWFVRLLGRAIPRRYNLPLDYSVFMEEVMIDCVLPTYLQPLVH